VREGDDVTIGCYGQFDWLSYYLQYNPITWVNTSIEFLEDSSTIRRPNILDVNQVRFRAFNRIPFRGPDPEVLQTTYTRQNVKPGQTISATCRIRFEFRGTAFSARYRYATNPLEYVCSVSQHVPCEYFRFYRSL